MKHGAVSLERALSKLGYASRKQARELIVKGRVAVNNQTIFHPPFRVDLKSAQIFVDGKIISQTQRIYVILNKPAGVITTRSDEMNRRTIYDL